MQKQRDETVAICKRIGLKIDGDLKQKTQMYCKAMTEQDTTTLQSMYLPAIFSQSEMSSLCQILKKVGLQGGAQGQSEVGANLQDAHGAFGPEERTEDGNAQHGACQGSGLGGLGA